MLTTLLGGAARNLAATARSGATDIVAGAAHLADLVTDRAGDRDKGAAVLRVAVLILSDADGPLCPPQAVRPALTKADEILTSQAGIRVRAASIRVLSDVAPDTALDPRANQRLLLDDMLGHTEFYRHHLPSQRGMGAPVTVVVVRNIAGRTTGCSLGMTADWVICQGSLFDPAQPNRYDDTVLVHELGHALNLPHHGDRANLMFASSSPPNGIRGTTLRPWQRLVLNANRHTVPAGVPAGDRPGSPAGCRPGHTEP